MARPRVKRIETRAVSAVWLSASAVGDHTGMAGYGESASCTLALSTTCSNRTSLSPEKVKT